MFKEIGQVMNLLRNQGKIQEELEKFQKQLGQLTAEGSGGGYVTVTVNGRLEVVSVRLSEDALKLQDKELLEDLIVAAANQALNKMRQRLAEEGSRMFGALGLFGLPGGLLGSPSPGST